MEPSIKSLQQALATAEARATLAEQARATEETARVAAEQARATEETARVAAEQARATEETARVAAEQARATEETARVAAEQARATEETARVAAEARAVAAEQTLVEERIHTDFLLADAVHTLIRENRWSTGPLGATCSRNVLQNDIAANGLINSDSTAAGFVFDRAFARG